MDSQRYAGTGRKALQGSSASIPNYGATQRILVMWHVTLLEKNILSFRQELMTFEKNGIDN